MIWNAYLLYSILSKCIVGRSLKQSLFIKTELTTFATLKKSRSQRTGPLLLTSFLRRNNGLDANLTAIVRPEQPQPSRRSGALPQKPTFAIHIRDASFVTQSQKAANRKLSGVVAAVTPGIVILVRAAEFRHVSIKRVHSPGGKRNKGTRKRRRTTSIAYFDPHRRDGINVTTDPRTGPYQLERNVNLTHSELKLMFCLPVSANSIMSRRCEHWKLAQISAKTWNI